MEHVEVDDRAVHNIYKPLVNSGIAFGAKRWVATLDRQCERLASSMASNIPAGDLCGTYIITISTNFFPSNHQTLNKKNLILWINFFLYWQ